MLDHVESRGARHHEAFCPEQSCTVVEEVLWGQGCRRYGTLGC